MTAAVSIYTIAAIAMVGVVVRPWRSPEVAWAIVGAVALVLLGFVPVRGALLAMAKGVDVYLFLIGMMLLSAIAEREGLFDYLAAACVKRARGSPIRLFGLVYAVGTTVTIFMSNDATAVVLTPAVLAVTRKAEAKPLPYLLACVNAEVKLTHFALNRRSKSDPPGALDRRCSDAQGVARSG